MDKSVLISKLENAYQTIIKLESLSSQVDNLNNESLYVSKRRDAIKNDSSQSSRVILFIGLLFLIGGGDTTIGVPFIIRFLVLIGSIIIFFIIEALSQSSKDRQAQIFYNSEMKKINEKKAICINQGKEIYISSSFQDATELISPEYFDSESIAYLIKVLKNNRADTLKEALNIYEDYLYKNKMEDIHQEQLAATHEMRELQHVQIEYAKQQLSATEAQNRYAKNIVRNTISTKRAVHLNTFLTLLKK